MKPKFSCKHTLKVRERTVKRVRRQIAELCAIRLTIIKTSKHIYAQVFTPDGAKVLACASSLDKDIKGKGKASDGKIAIAKLVGSLVADRAKKNGIENVAVDRSGYKYHGRIKALIEAVREAGIKC